MLSAAGYAEIKLTGPDWTEFVVIVVAVVVLTGNQAGLHQARRAALARDLLRRGRRGRGRVLGSVVPPRDPQDSDAGGRRRGACVFSF